MVLYDIIDGTVAKRYKGHKQTFDYIRSCAGGVSHGFVISGSEDSTIYVWHRDSREPLEYLSGHSGGCVNDVSWNPGHAGMFASAGDDRTVRIWQASSSSSPSPPHVQGLSSSVTMSDADAPPSGW